MRVKIGLGIVLLCGYMAVASASTESDYLRVGNLVFITGQAAKSDQPGVAIDAALAQICKVANQAAVDASRADKGCGNIVKLDIYLKNYKLDFPQMNKVISKYFTSPYPTRNTVGVTQIPGDNTVEINAVMSLE